MLANRVMSARPTTDSITSIITEMAMGTTTRDIVAGMTLDFQGDMMPEVGTAAEIAAAEVVVVTEGDARPYPQGQCPATN